jgi:hypothetical protein
MVDHQDVHSLKFMRIFKVLQPKLVFFIYLHNNIEAMTDLSAPRLNWLHIKIKFDNHLLDGDKPAYTRHLLDIRGQRHDKLPNGFAYLITPSYQDDFFKETNSGVYATLQLGTGSALDLTTLSWGIETSDRVQTNDIVKNMPKAMMANISEILAASNALQESMDSKDCLKRVADVLAKTAIVPDLIQESKFKAQYHSVSTPSDSPDLLNLGTLPDVSIAGMVDRFFTDRRAKAMIGLHQI